ncbi:MAG: hypothetical protein M3033_12270 [Acidobacteriota bacterium]|nr:hypothetical protein [Acidobacteriota bacterium]
MIKNLILIMFVLSAVASAQSKQFTEDLMQKDCAFETSGRNQFFILEPGYQLTLENKKGGKLIVTVLNETRKIGNVETRIVEENESENGKPVEISRNFFAFCRQTASVYYFGEEVDIYKNGKMTKGEDAWTAEGNNRAGVAMPGLILIGARYYQEIAPGRAMDRAEIVGTQETKNTPAGAFTNCLKTEETTPLEPKEKEYKLYAPGIGLIQDEDLLLTKYGFVKLENLSLKN